MRLLLFNLAMDLDDPLLEFAVYWVRALAERVERVYVITMREGRAEVPDNVRIYSVGKEKGYSEPRRAMEFYRILFRILREDRIDGCFSHMMPVFTVLAAPLLKWRRTPIVTWYAHPSLTVTLKLAHHFSTQMVTSLPTAYPYTADKLTVIGQGIPTDLFSPDDGELPKTSPMILCVGRLSPVKDHPTLLKAACLLHQRSTKPFQVVIVGGPAGPRDESYVTALREHLKGFALEGIVDLKPAASMSSLPLWYGRCEVHVNMTPTGFGDKVALEAMACGKPCLVANEGFKETLGKFADHLLFRHGDAEHLAEKLLALLELSERDREEMGHYLRQRIIELHSLHRLTYNLMEVFHKIGQCEA